MLAITSLMQIRIAAFAKKEHHHKISNIEMMTLPTGIANIVGTDCGWDQFVCLRSNTSLPGFLRAPLAVLCSLVDSSSPLGWQCHALTGALGSTCRIAQGTRAAPRYR